METRVRQLFERYEDVFNQALAGEADMDEVAALYAAEFIGGSPAGVIRAARPALPRIHWSQNDARRTGALLRS